MQIVSVNTVVMGIAVLWLTSILRTFYTLYYPDLSFSAHALQQAKQSGSPPLALRPIWQIDETEFDITVLVDTYAGNFADRARKLGWDSNVILRETNPLRIADSREWIVNISSRFLGREDNNATLYAHVYITRTGLSPDPKSANFDSQHLYSVKPLTKFMTLQQNMTRNLLSGAQTTEADTKSSKTSSGKAGKKGLPIVSHVKKKLMLRIVEDRNEYPLDKVPPELAPHLVTDRATMQYRPVLFLDDTWLLKTDFLPLNSSVKNFTVVLSYSPISLGWYRWTMQMDQAMKMMTSLMGGQDDEDTNEVKQMLAETSPTLLMITMVISIFHLAFDFLAFKSDIQWWRNRKSFVGISAHSLIMSLVSRTIIFLYLIDQEASRLVLVSAVFTVVINAWKIIKILRVSIVRSERFSWLYVPKLGLPTAKESDTQQYDKKATKLLYMILLPIAACYSIYSLIYQSHKSWYSWALSSFASAMYVGGFIMMTPQLFINYKLKTVAHLPWQVFIYRAVNTFIDDLFAFLIAMPTMHRLSVFRDDIVFFIYLYQRWIYPVDKSRASTLDEDEGEATSSQAVAVSNVNSNTQSNGSSTAAHPHSE